MPTMPAFQPIADALVVVFTYGVSLRTWQETGGIDRELAMYRAIADRYQRIVLFTYGGPADSQILKDALPAELHDKFILLCNAERATTAEYAAAAPALVKRALGQVGSLTRLTSAVVKTNQMVGGRVAVKIAAGLTAEGVRCALVARGGYLWSRMAAYQHGNESRQAREAGETEAVLCEHADMVVGTTSGMIDDLAWRYGLGRERTRVISNYTVVPSNVAKPVDERTPGLLLFAGELTRRKRVDVLIDAVAMLDEEGRRGVTLEIVGDGPEMESLSEQAHRLGAPVIFRGRLPHAELNKRMGECTLYLQASEMEGHPKTVLEAMAAGAAVVVANTPGQGETVAHGVTGLRVALDAEAFSRAIVELSNDPDWRDVLGAGAARAAQAGMSLGVIAPMEIESHEAALRGIRGNWHIASGKAERLAG